MPKYTENDYYSSRSEQSEPLPHALHHSFVDFVVFLANLLYRIPLDDADRKLLIKSLKRNKDFLKAMNFDEDVLDLDLFKFVDECLKRKYSERDEK